jgi:hypothetical protein
MAVMDATNRARTTAHWQRINTEPTPFAKTVLRAAVDATDQWIEDNQAAWLAALPAGFRTNTTAQQKTLLFMHVVMRRAGLLPTQEDVTG